MLYISARSKTDSFTAYRTLCSDQAPDGGAYIPYQLPCFTAQDLSRFKVMSFGQIVADILNQFYSLKLSAWDVEICAGKQPVRIKEIPHRMIMAETCHNPQSDYGYMEQHLYKKLAGKDAQTKPTCWARIAFRVCLLFGVHAAFPGRHNKPFDLCVNGNDPTDAIAAYYAKKMGLPIRKIICCCTDNSALWDLTQRGEMSVSSHSDKHSVYLVETLLFHYFGRESVDRLQQALASKTTFRLDTDASLIIGDDFTSVVIGRERTTELVRSVKNNSNYDITDAAAICFGCLQDYRAASGDICDTMILVDQKL